MPHTAKSSLSNPTPRITAVLAALIVALGAAGAVRAQTAGLPPLVQPASSEHHAGKVVFEQLVTPDLPGTERFYGGLFGWTFQHTQLGDADIAEAMLGGHPVAALVGRPLPSATRRQPAWLTFFAAPNVDAATALAVQNKAKILFAPADIPGLGREAVLADPQGAIFALLASSSGDPPDALAEPGTWIWSSLVTTAPDAAAAFYQTLFNFDVYDLPGDQEAQHLLIASEDFARGSINPLPADRQGMRPRWLNFVRVTDADAAAAKVTALGGQIVLPPQLDRHGGKVVVALDPVGAPFGLMEWSADQPPGAGK